MAAVAFIGDELTGTGYRLAGARAWIVPPEAAGEALRAAREEASLVLLSPRHARHVPGEELEAALRSFSPLVLVVDDILEHDAPPDLERAMRSALGVEAP